MNGWYIIGIIVFIICLCVYGATTGIDNRNNRIADAVIKKMEQQKIQEMPKGCTCQQSNK